ncbi:NUDIX hydrolase [Nocardiopsis composta]|uniref:8-oxo-dGTP pyrophosphatase MutT (NUDIX family) n=1 Tax=Nocardiopsis composta TaxID=157465 RepID=A0A7W8VF36_9ACTN|nr:NUDIX hydrolase [Nocardiopsis composta]MBB5433718.1 8-oxo-dGTP pyrophosphatase MutT (NUDIX family) [Nocardiopsis composta]
MTREPVRPRDAATVMLVREGSGPGGGIEVYMLRRAPSMPFAPGAYAFPGGRVDERDADRDVGWAGPPPEEWARILGTGVPTARALVCAAVRETFEESGVLLAGPSADRVVADTRDEAWEADRLALVDHSLSFADLLARRGLVLRTDLLRAWSQWITPAGEPRRYDTRFFTAVLPEGQQTRDVGGEADRVAWIRPAEAVRRWRAGELAMLPPTIATCMDLAECGSVAEATAGHRSIFPIEPVLREIDGEQRIVVPDGAVYPLLGGQEGGTR